MATMADVVVAENYRQSGFRYVSLGERLHPYFRTFPRDSKFLANKVDEIEVALE